MLFPAYHSIYAIICKPLPSVGYLIALSVKTIFSAWVRVNKKAIAGYMQTKQAKVSAKTGAMLAPNFEFNAPNNYADILGHSIIDC
jgi:hypothetical protein